MKQVAIVVQRSHKSIVGGSEALAWQYANLLNDEFKVDIITTTALDYATWANELPPGCETQQGINIYRFPVSIGRSNYWHNLHERLVKEFQKYQYRRITNSQTIPWNIALQEEFIRRQGPYSLPLLSFLKQRWSDYQSIIFATYLYPTTYFGILQVPSSKVLLIPTLHDEPAAYLSAYKYMACRARLLIWVTNAEKVLGESLWGELPGKVVSMSVDTTPYSPYKTKYPYILYSGRIDSRKGCNDLINFFIQFKKDISSTLRLILTGKNEIEIPNHPDIDFKGFVSSEEKFKLMAGASIFVMPSPYESFSIVTLEAMAQCTPVLVNGLCQVLVEHVERSGGGKIYHNYDEFSAAIQTIMADQNQRVVMGNLARDYVVSNDALNNIKSQLIEIVNSCCDE
ncbi:glycosyltransferase family 4 protein [Halotia branconii]|uniref:Glycosyltransferase n=1 Tax=Halotia branconii CENA392 TaxID=1539056 RepID=A0AAJ6P986_9CYAN|nr:glycosyltransferase [Halotia branconii]WGV25485.1 glycosyltransferase [Halotia branconii CENA392]